ncbi:hypothetical protein ACSBPH_02785 [Microbacterium sp. F51-2R]|uniref:hypothetical protein n=1 Tax=Microbacterium sp. F51-2R TaxID=3445777 RepID=UPI003FA0A171
MVASTVVYGYGRTSRLEPHELVRALNEALGPTLVAFLVGSTSRAQPHEWAKPGGAEPRPPARKRLQFAHQIWSAVEEAEGADVARRWFIGGNPLLGGDLAHPPVMTVFVPGGVALEATATSRTALR